MHCLCLITTGTAKGRPAERPLRGPLARFRPRRGVGPNEKLSGKPAAAAATTGAAASATTAAAAVAAVTGAAATAGAGPVVAVVPAGEIISTAAPVNECRLKSCQPCAAYRSSLLFGDGYLEAWAQACRISSGMGTGVPDI